MKSKLMQTKKALLGRTKLIASMKFTTAPPSCPPPLVPLGQGREAPALSPAQAPLV